MKYSPLDIKNQHFNKSLRGYDVDEVQIYLESISEFLADILDENEKLKNDMGDISKQLDEYKKIERELQNTLLTAQESSSKSVETAKKQTALMIKEAELKAAQIVDNAKEDANFTRNSVLNLKEERMLLIARLKAIVETQKKLLPYLTDANDVANSNENDPPDKNKGDINVGDILDKIL